MIHEIIGWLASAFFAVCLIPQAWKTHKEGSEGLSLGFALFTFLGNLGMLDFLISQGVSQPQLYLNPSVALLLSAYLLYKIIYPNRISIFNEKILTAEELHCIDLILDYMKDHEVLHISPYLQVNDSVEIWFAFSNKVRANLLKSRLKHLGYDMHIIEEDTYDRYYIKKSAG